MKIFISGKPSSGKTTLIIKLANYLKSIGKSFCGIATPEIRENNIRIGFKVIDLRSIQGRTFASVNFKTKFSVGKYFVDVKIFDEIFSNAVKNFESYDYVLIDEIGKMEFFSENFKNFVENILRKDVNLIATIHRKFFPNYKKFGYSYWLERENFNEIFENLKRLL